ncbi:hypothetical protein FNH13_10465 [Ornithinimicrobium ciconiae]|uniref:Uncharacterized protein n=1 Tax=Ornithinimicrobium ciconiae TaxID=2594265 RepID=A0A516GBF3_9MICO|nr:hypothetical protein [Ornithinimicrobium ciconiae]QDO88700.1 hypothetical protein FNH13_10465 [Ornithinimicrobium ciconiae]
MAMLVRTEHDLPTVRIAYRDGGRVTVRVWLQRGGDEPHLVAECRGSELGPLDFKGGEPATDDQFSLPSDVLRALATQVPTLGDSAALPTRALWLELPSPRGYLHLVPWEQLLAPLGRPLVRLPNYTVRPRAQSQTLEVALCAGWSVVSGEFDAAGSLAALARVWRSVSGRPTTVHVFSDGWVYERLRSLVEGEEQVIAHDPGQWQAGDQHPSATGNSWLGWMGRELRGKALDVVHLVGHGYLSGGRGGVAMSMTPSRLQNQPESDDWAGDATPVGEFVGAPKLAQFVAGQGAWSFIASGAPDNYSGAALREVADVLALNSPGITISHDLGLDPDAEQLARVLTLVLTGQDTVETAHPAIAAWAHPRFVAYPEESLMTSSGHSVMVQQATQDLLAGAHTPVSVAAATRYLESLQAKWVTAGDAPDPDAVTALRTVSDLIETRATELGAPR